MRILNNPLLDLNGNVIKSGDTDMTVAVALTNCCLAPTPDGRARTQTDVAARYDLAIRLHSLQPGEGIEIPVEMLAKLKEDVLRVYTTIIAGQMLPILDGEKTH